MKKGSHLSEEHKKRIYRENNKEKIKEQKKNYYQLHKEEGKNYQKNYNQFHKEEIAEWHKKNYLLHKEKICKRSKKYYLLHKEKKKKYKKEYHQLHKEKIKKYNKKYRRLHKDELSKQEKVYQRLHKERINKYRKDRRLSNESFALKSRLRALLWHAFRHYSKTGKVWKARAYEIDYSKIIKHLGPCPGERKDYHIDHIKPLRSFDFNNLEQIRLAFAPENHQWLTAEENWKKGAK